jgi:hypothetical protein
MSLSIGSSLSGGVGRIANRNGLKLIAAYLVVGALWQVSLYSALVAALQGSGLANSEIPLPSVDVPLAVAAGAAVVSFLLLQYLTIVAVRTLVGGHSRTIPREYFSRNIGFVMVNTIIGGTALAVVVNIGFLLLLVPGIVAAVAFIFVTMYLAVEDENFVAAFRDSWRLTRGHWLRLFGLFLIIGVGVGAISGILSMVSSVAVGTAGGQQLGTLISGVVVLPFSLLSISILADAFTQLREGERGAAEL